jgi:hypothetical protein
MKKIILTENQLKRLIKNQINELHTTGHYASEEYGRLRKRFMDTDMFYVKLYGYTESDRRVLGYYTISPELKSQIVERIYSIEERQIPENRNSSYGIVIHKFNIGIDDVDFITDENRDQAAFSIKNNRPLMISDIETESNGDILIMIVKSNKIITVMFERSHQGTEELRKRKNLDFLIKYDTFMKKSVPHNKN